MRYIIKTKIAILFSCISFFTFAQSYTDTAKVISIEDIYNNRTIQVPYQDCYVANVREKVADDSATNELLGGILGGAIGNQFGKGDGKKVMTGMGALLGASIAHDNDRSHRIVQKQICKTKYNNTIERSFSHYLVRYKYNNNVYSYTTNNKPYSNINVRVSVTPI